MKKVLILICLINSGLFAQELKVWDHSSNSEIIYHTEIPCNFNIIRFNNNIIIFGTEDVHGYDQFLLDFDRFFVKRIIQHGRNGFRRTDFRSEEFYLICRRLLDRGEASPIIPSLQHTIMVISDGTYGFLIHWWNGRVMQRYFFEFK